MAEDHVRVWEEDVVIPTYGIGEPDKNPLFLEKRVYQGSSGKVYPYPVVDRVLDEKRPQTYRLVFLENAYLHIALLPEIGGRIYRALDKTNGYDFVYYNRVIKPALVGLAGPWISGGIEFNWPQHHRPNTFGPVAYTMAHHEDGSKTVWLSDTDRMYGTSMTAGFTLYPGRASLEIKVQLANRTPLAQTFLWWANPAFAASEQTQSIFPPDVHAVFDHGRRDVSRFPIATGRYYQVDYSTGVDISRYPNIPVPTSYMAHASKYDFLGGYDHARQAGLLHIANHHLSPGKKQWTWGNGAFGQAWERQLTDEDGPYIELMTGAYTDNQPDFSWLQPYEEKTFTQHFFPYKQLGTVKNASLDSAVNLEVNPATHRASVQVYATALFEEARIRLTGQTRCYLDTTATISPTDLFQMGVELEQDEKVENLRLCVQSAQGKELVVYQPEVAHIEPLPEAAKPMPAPEALPTVEALYLAGQHLEQYRHATFAPDPYYLEGLKRDPDESRLNIAYGALLLRRGNFADSERHFRRAVQSLTRYNPNPQQGEVWYYLGLSLLWQQRPLEAEAALYKATWSAAWQEGGFFALAQIASARSAYDTALELVESALTRNARNYQARGLQITLLRKLGRLEEAAQAIETTLRLNPTDCWAYHERLLLAQARDDTAAYAEAKTTLAALIHHEVHLVLALAADYAHGGFFLEAADVLSDAEATGTHPLLSYHLGYYAWRAGQPEQARAYWREARTLAPDYCFPNTLDDLLTLECALQGDPEDAMAHYYLGNLLYDKQRHLDAIAHWEQARALHPTFATVQRNLALAYYNVLKQPDAALSALESAFALNTQDARVLFELDQLYKKCNNSPERRLSILEQHRALVERRDDLSIEYITLLNTLGRHEQALRLLTSRRFHPWEGGEGKVIGQYVLALTELGKAHLRDGQDQQALERFQQALLCPDNLGEARLGDGQINHVFYALGCAYERLGRVTEAYQAFQSASRGGAEPSSPMFYNDQPPDMLFYQGLAWLKSGDQKEAHRSFHTLINYGEQHLFDHVSIDYFAVSLPDFLVFEDDLQKRNQTHCYYMLGLGYLGLGNYGQARTYLERVLELESNHQGARVHITMLA